MLAIGILSVIREWHDKISEDLSSEIFYIKTGFILINACRKAQSQNLIAAGILASIHHMITVCLFALCRRQACLVLNRDVGSLIRFTILYNR